MNGEHEVEQDIVIERLEEINQHLAGEVLHEVRRILAVPEGMSVIVHARKIMQKLADLQSK